jgi:S-adenosyl-L-methionine hydrolase (adenosine-forming)
MRIVTLISDWNSADYYIGAVKGRILATCPDTLIVDVNHQIPSYNINQAAFVLKNTYKNFPEGTIHIVAVQTEQDSERPFIVAKYNGHYFIGVDNGLFFMIMETLPEEIVVPADLSNVGSFPELEVFSKCAVDLLKDKPLSEIGIKREQLFKQLPILPAVEENVISGKVIYIDSYQNIITNIDKATFDKFGTDRTFVIYVQSKGNRITRLNKTYNETSPGDLLALFNSCGLLEIAIRNGKAAELFGINTSSAIRVVFGEKIEGPSDRKQTLF